MLTKNIIKINDNFFPIAIANPSRITDKTIPISTITINNSVIFNKNISKDICKNIIGTYKRASNILENEMKNNKIEITSQNHGFAVDKESLPSNAVITHTHLNDNTVAGIECKSLQAYSVQYHPESSPGPHDSRYIFKQFFQMMDKNAKKK